MAQIITSNSMGFCFGVRQAYETAEKSVSKFDNLVILGELLHNDTVLEDFKNKGIGIIYSADEAKDGFTVIIRAHGEGPDTYKKLEKKGVNIIDATCPSVKKIHKIVSDQYSEGKTVIIIGDENHPEIVGINGWCQNKAIIIKDFSDVEKLHINYEDPVCVVSQTTFSTENFIKICNFLRKAFKNVEIFDTICLATKERQKSTEELAKKSDVVFVVGNKKSSNTLKLFDICKRYSGKAHMIENAGEIPTFNINNYKIVGITAGASTPDTVIKEVINLMDNINSQNSDVNFKDVFENSLVTLTSGEVVKGKIIGYSANEVYVDLGYKSDGVIAMHEYSDDPQFVPSENIKTGDEITVLILRVNDAEGVVVLSKKRVDHIKSTEDIEKAFESGEPLKVKIKESVKGGVIGIYGGIRVFIPAMQLSDRFVKDLNEFVNKEIDVKIIEYNPQKRKIIGSARVLIEKIKKEQEKIFWENAKVGDVYTGEVRTITNFGAFVDMEGISGLIHINELSWDRIRHPSEAVSVGQTVSVKILELDESKKRISLGFKKPEDDPWAKASKYQEGDIIDVKIVRIKAFGAFAEIEKGLDGLVHVSKISDRRIGKPDDVLTIGQIVKAKIMGIDPASKKISLSIKDVEPINEKISDKGSEVKAVENVDSPAEAEAEENISE